jgi:hypothetical protein
MKGDDVREFRHVIKAADGKVLNEAAGVSRRTPSPAIAPFTDADVQRIAALPAAEQVEEVRKELMRRNPGFDGKMETKIEGGVVTEFKIVTDKVTDIAPIRVFIALRVLSLTGTWTDRPDRPNGQLADLTPLEGMNLAHLTNLDLSYTRVGDAGIVHFKDCKNLHLLNLVRTKITDAGLANFKDCQNLEYLELAGTHIGDPGMEHLKECRKLKKLGLYATQVGDAGLANFKDCKNLINLDLNVTRVTDAGMANFKDCKNLNLVALMNTEVSDAGLAYLQNSKKIDWLYLNDTKVSDAGLMCLKDKASMTRLWLDRTQVTDAAIVHLQGLTNLASLSLLGTEVTAAGLTTLQKSLPKCTIRWSADTSPDRRAAEWALRYIDGATVRINNQAETIQLATDLPEQPFQLTAVALSGVQVNDLGLAKFKGCKSLAYLDLVGTLVTDKGLVHFKDCKGLRELRLERTFVSDAGLQQLQELKNLTLVELGRTKVTASGVQQLSAALPNCKITWDGGVIEPRVGFAPFTDAAVQRIAVLLAAPRVNEVQHLPCRHW